MNRLIVFLLCFTLAEIRAADLVLFDASRRNFSIATSRSTPGEQAAARLLQTFLNKQSRFTWPIQATAAAAANQILIQEAPVAGCTIQIRQGNILLRADSALLRTCVAFFLERFAGTKVYSDEVVYAPLLSRCAVPASYQQTFTPAFESRVLFERSAFDTTFAAWHGLSNIPGPLDQRRSLTWGIMAHSFFDLVPPDQYFSSHPEYYSLRGGKRVTEQLCLSHPALVEIAAKNLTRLMARQPGLQNWSVSQMDNQGYCECDNCSRIAAAERAQSGPILRFVNAVAKYFPDKHIGTLAYQYSRKAPALTSAAKNVVVTVCAYESDRSKPLNDPRQKDDFAKDLQDWSARCSKLMVWDYTINFISIATPFPNFHVLQPNLQYFKKAGVKMVFEQGWHASGGGLQEYRAYLLAKLLWDPAVQVEGVKADFFNHYYGAGGKYLVQVLDLMQRQFQASDTLLGITAYPAYYAGGYLKENLRKTYLSLIDQALAAVNKDAVIWKRVDAFAQAFRLAEVQLNGAIIGTRYWVDRYSAPERVAFKRYNDSLLNQFVDKTRQYGPVTMIENRLTPQEWKYQERNLFKKDAEDNLVTGADISFRYPPNHLFPKMGPKALVDGAFGTDDWSSTWQAWFNTDIDATLKLKNRIRISSVSMRFMKEPAHDLGVPVQLLVFVSDDGIRYEQVAKLDQPPLNNQLPKEIVTFTARLKTPVQARFIHVVAKAPAFVLNGDARKPPFIFSDEIYVR